jgi:hypothetical protein
MKQDITVLVLAVTVAAALGVACTKDAPAPGTGGRETWSGTERAAAPDAHAAAGAQPGSYEDWCGEHEVPESMCTRCNPALVAAFKATNDWCAEHGLPESQCKLCNPELKIERPPKPLGTE